MALGYTDNVPPSTGLGNIMPMAGQPNAPGAGQPRPMMGVNDPRPQVQPARIGNMPMPQARPGNFGQIMQQLPPAAMQALRGIPREALQHLHNAGLIHPGVMQHMYGQTQ